MAQIGNDKHAKTICHHLALLCPKSIHIGTVPRQTAKMSHSRTFFAVPTGMALIKLVMPRYPAMASDGIFFSSDSRYVPSSIALGIVTSDSSNLYRMVAEYLLPSVRRFLNISGFAQGKLKEVNSHKRHKISFCSFL